jgi:hypothetical protein
MLLEGGRLASDGNVGELIQEYHRRVLEPASGASDDLAERHGAGRFHRVFRTALLVDDHGEPTNFLPLGGLFHLRLGLDAAITLEFPTISVGIDDHLGHRLLTVQTPLSQPAIDEVKGVCQVDCRVEKFPLAPGEYWVKLGLTTAGAEIDEVDRVLHFSVTNADKFGEGRGIHLGLCVAPSQWSMTKP